MSMLKESAAGAALLAFVLIAGGCQSTGGTGAANEAAEPVAMAAAEAPEGEAAEAAEAEATEIASAETEAVAPAAACTAPRMAIAGPPPVPNKAASLAGGMVENAGRNAARNTGTAAANQVVGRIPGIGGVIGVATTQVAAKEVVKTAEDVRGTWTATDGAPTCGCTIEFSRPGMVMTKNVVKTAGCASPVLAAAARWQVVDTGFAKQDLVLYGADGKSVVARLDRKGVDYFQGEAGGQSVTIWR